MALTHKVTNLNDLSDTALLSVMEYLSIDELCVVKGVCHRLRKMASRTFERRYDGAVHFDDLMFNMPEIVRIIKCFGPIIKSVTVHGSIAWELNTTILTLLTQKCSKLKKLKLICYHFDKPEIAIMKTLAQHLEVIFGMKTEYSFLLRSFWLDFFFLVHILSDSQ